MKSSKLTTIGRAERIRLLEHGEQNIPAKVDTGADLSSVWASAVHENQHGLSFTLFDRQSEYYSGKVIILPAAAYRTTRVANSFGHREIRYVVKLRVRVQGRVIKSTFTLSDRSAKIYPILLGRRLLTGKFVVDVATGEPLIAEEKEKLRKLHIVLAANEIEANED